MVFSLALGFASRPGSRTAAGGGGDGPAAVLVTLGPLLLVAIIEAHRGPGPSGQELMVLLAPSPGYALMVASVPGAPGVRDAALLAFGGPHVRAVARVSDAQQLTVPRVWHDLPHEASPCLAALADGAGLRRRRSSRRLPATTAGHQCLLLADVTGPAAAAVCVGGVRGGRPVLALGRIEFGNDWEDPGALVMWSQGLYGVVKLWIAAAVWCAWRKTGGARRSS